MISQGYKTMSQQLFTKIHFDEMILKSSLQHHHFVDPQAKNFASLYLSSRRFHAYLSSVLGSSYFYDSYCISSEERDDSNDEASKIEFLPLIYGRISFPLWILSFSSL